MRVIRILGIISQYSIVAKASSGSCIPQFDPVAVNLAVRSTWCAGQINTCGILCTDDYDTNVCDPYTLCYECICNSNSSSPALQYYTQTIPTFQCEYAYQNCIAASSNDASAQKKCTDTERANCGHINPETLDFSIASATYSSSSPTPSAPYRISAPTILGTEQIISTTETVTPSPTATTTVWSTSTAGFNGNGNGNGTSGIGIGSAGGNYSTFPGVTHISVSGATSTLSGNPDLRTGSSVTGALVKPSTVSANMAKRTREVNWIWNVLTGVGFAGFLGMGF